MPLTKPQTYPPGKPAKYEDPITKSVEGEQDIWVFGFHT
jgi:hypothetical protein